LELDASDVDAAALAHAMLEDERARGERESERRA
jgi:hypothetical protein